MDQADDLEMAKMIFPFPHENLLLFLILLFTTLSFAVICRRNIVRMRSNDL